jgi:hypothetical protein
VSNDPWPLGLKPVHWKLLFIAILFGLAVFCITHQPRHAELTTGAALLDASIPGGLTGWSVSAMSFM